MTQGSAGARKKMMSISLTMLCVSIANTVGVASRRMTAYGEPDVSTCAVAELPAICAMGAALFLRDEWLPDKLGPTVEPARATSPCADNARRGTVTYGLRSWGISPGVSGGGRRRDNVAAAVVREKGASFVALWVSFDQLLEHPHARPAFCLRTRACAQNKPGLDAGIGERPILGGLPASFHR